MEKIDVEHLQKLTYERSKTWSSFFEGFENDDRVVRLKDLRVEIDVTTIETLLSPEKSDDSSDLASMEDDNYADDVNSEFLQNASNHSQFSLFNCGSTMIDLLPPKSDEEKQYLDMINKTLPVFNEHERQLKENGFDKVLISFKKDEIENKFGTWLNRNNSLFISDNSLMSECNKERNFETGKEATANHKSKSNFSKNKELDSDSDASLQSGETARYIRSSRIGSIKNSTSTLIKTYRMVSSTRRALREKYACETDEDDYHENALRLNTKRNMECKNLYDMTPFGRSSKKERLALATRTQRRKVLRKRISSSSCCASNSSSDSEYSYENYHKFNGRKLKSSFNQYQCFATNYFKTPLTTVNKNNVFKTCSNIKMPTGMRNRFYYFCRSHSMSFSSSSPSSSFNSTCEKRRAIKRNAELCKDERPRKRESECRCCNDKELCKKFRHVADTSTDDWFVENGCSKTHFKTPQTKTQTKKSNSKSCESKLMQKVEDNVKNKKNSKENKNKIKNEEKHSLSEESSDLELQMALKASLEIYEKEQEANRAKPTKSHRKNKEENLSRETDVESKKASRKIDKVIRKTGNSEEIKVSSKKPNDTFFTPICNSTQAICNSTALSTKGRAFNRQFADKQQIVEESEMETLEDNTMIDLKKTKIKPKSTKKKLTSTRISADKGPNENSVAGSTVTSTTLRSPDLHFSVILPHTENKQIEQKNDINCDDQSNCTHVTSTTNVEIPVNKTICKESENSPKRNSTSNNFQNMMQNCILIYDPDNRNMASASSSTKDDYFTVTKEHLSGIIGEKAAEKFFKYYVGRKCFKLNSLVYYKPPINSFQRLNLSSSSESADDLDNMGQYGDLFAVTK